ncbi:NACHT domain-containing protein [Crossiella sp. SN42]|uniref:NACHT domain-containing protein n=1 Tax=Crossiella sp. SN42 TaxID=2944808 RepID=UPI00207D60E9|nr:NACHT domain-containing protein [Crossiella sp. SN42]MCO1578153.1 NACHT domain-containing protein [Crossiella sp. SN42]
MLNEAALAVGRQVVRHTVRAWLDQRKAQSDRHTPLSELIAVAVPDAFSRRKLERRLADIGDQAAHRLRPWYDVEFRDLPEHERRAALDAVADALAEADLSDRTLFEADLDPAKLARLVRDRVPSAVVRAGLSDAAADLYSAVLDESCMALVSVVRQLPAFSQRADAEFLSRFAAVAEKIELVLHRLPRTSLDAPQGSAHDAEFRRRYLGYLSETLDELELFGVDTRRYRPHTSVSVAYLSLRVTSAGGEDEDFSASGWRAADGGQRVESALADRSRTLLRGDAGSGKTTLMQWLSVSAARGTFTGKLAPWNNLVPFLVRLRGYADTELPEPQDLVAANAGPIAGLAPTGWVHRLLSDGQALLLVDGVDELTADRRPRVRRWLKGLLAAYPDLRVVVTARPSAADRSWLDAEGFRAVRLEPMTPLDIAEFTRRWHEAIRGAALPCEPEELDEYRTTLLRHLESRPALRMLATSPLLCALLCALNLDRRKQLPPDRMKLYEAALELLLDRRDAEREVPAAQELTLEPATKLGVLQYLAWSLSMCGRTQLDLADASGHVQRALARMPSVELHPATVLQHLLERSGVLREPVEGKVDFIHRTFQEYLTGKEIADHHLVGFLVQQAHLDTWRETVVLAAGHCSVPLRAELLDGILDRADAERRHARKLRLLAAACLETTHTVPEQVAARVDAVLDQLVPPRDSREVRSLVLAGEQVLRKLPSTVDGLSDAVATACVETAALVNGPAGLRVLSRYASDPRISVQRDLAWAWRHFDPEEYAVQVLGNAPLADGSVLVTEYNQLPHLHHLRHLRWTRINVIDSKRTDLEFLAGVPHLRSLSHTNDPAADLHELTEHPRLAYLRLHQRCRSLDFLSALPRLRTLKLTPPEGLTDLWFLADLLELRELDLNGCHELTDLTGLATCKDLDTLSLGQAWTLTDLSPLELLPKLTDLSLDQLTELPDLSALTPLMPRLTRLWLSELNVPDLEPLAGSSLSELDLHQMPEVDLSPLAGLAGLRLLDLGNTEAVYDLAPLAGLNQRMTLRLFVNQEVRNEDKLGPNIRVVRH